MWSKVKASQGDADEIASILVTFFYYMHEEPLMEPRATEQEWLDSFISKMAHFLDPGYIELIGRIVKKSVTKEQAQGYLKQWYGQYIVPVLEDLIKQKGYRYDLEKEGLACQEEWGENGFNIRPDQLKRIIKGMMVPLQGTASYDSCWHHWDGLKDQRVPPIKRVDCIVWDRASIQAKVHGDRALLLLPKNNYKHSLFGLRELMCVELTNWLPGVFSF